MSGDLNAVAEAGMAALRRGDGTAARIAFATVEAAGRGTHQLRLLLAQACVMAADAEGAHRALDAVLREEPTNLYALILRGDVHAGGGNPRAATSWYRAAIAQAPRAGPLPADLIEALRRAEASVAQASRDFEAHLNQSLALATMAPPGSRFDEALAILTGRATPQLQQPSSFYFPGLTPRPFFDRNEFSWASDVEASATAIGRELATILDDPSALAPYVVADPDRPAKRHALLGDLQWSAFHLFKDGEPIAENAERVPATMAALAHVPMPRIAGRSPMALFSILRPRTHIPPHHGMLNTRLICHLPLIVPPDCRLRVGNETRNVEPNRLMIFDDSIEHEAWNDSDALRAVLLFEIWRPDLSQVERTALTTLYEAISEYIPPVADQAGA